MLRHRRTLLLTLPLLLIGAGLVVNVPGLRDTPEVWAQFEGEPDSRERMELLVALGLRGALDDLDADARGALLMTLPSKERRYIVSLLPGTFGPAYLGLGPEPRHASLDRDSQAAR